MTATEHRVDKNVLGRGVSTISEAARLTHLRPQRVREWFRGRNSPSKHFRPVFHSDYPILGEAQAISFLDLIELKIAGTLRTMGISLPYLRKVHAHLAEELGAHPFCLKTIYTTGKKIFTRGLNDLESKKVTEVITRQGYFESVIAPFLRAVEYDKKTEQATRWHIAQLVVVDPEIQFGKPTVEGIGISTQVLHGAYYGNGEDADLVARWYGIETKHVTAAVAFEDGLAA